MSNDSRKNIHKIKVKNCFHLIHYIRGQDAVFFTICFIVYSQRLYI